MYVSKYVKHDQVGKISSVWARYSQYGPQHLPTVPRSFPGNIYATEWS